MVIIEEEFISKKGRGLLVADLHNKDDEIPKASFTGKLIVMFIILLLISIPILFILGVFFFGFAGIFTLLGIQYNSIWSLILFVLAYFMIGFVVDIFFDGLRKLTVQYTKGRLESFTIQLIISFLGNYMVISIVELLISSISLSLGTKIIIVLLNSLLDVVFDDKAK